MASNWRRFEVLLPLQFNEIDFSPMPERLNGDDSERLILARSPRFQALLNRSRQSLKEGKGLSETAFWTAVRKRARSRKTTTSARGPS